MPVPQPKMSQPKKAEDKDTFQNQRLQTRNVFALHHYKALEIFLTLTGLNPYSTNRGSKIMHNVVFYSLISGIVPLVLQFYKAILAKDVDETIDVLPHILIATVSLIKFGNILLNKERIKTLLDLIVKDWETMGSELHMLDRITATGCRLAYLYRVTLLSFTMIFNYIPLIPPTLDIILPRNETRSKHQLFQVNYIFFNADDHFMAVYLHMFWAGSLTVFVVVTVDSLYMLIIHHASGLFDVCGYQIEMTCREGDLKEEMFRQCLITHQKALEFSNFLQNCSQRMNLWLVGMNMLLISTTGVQIILYMDRPLDSVRFVLFFLGEHFHLYIVSLLGQILLNHSLLLPDKIYSSNWHEIPIKIQKLLYTMIIRCNKPCILSAGGLYDMSMENYGKAVKACMSYFTMFLSMRE